MKRLITGIIAVAVLAYLPACAQKDDKTATASPELIASLSYPAAVAFDANTLRVKYSVENSTKNAVNTFAYKTLSPVLANSEGNTCFSPLSLYYALALVTAGAAGTTQQEMLSLLNFSADGNLSARCADMYEQLYTDNEISKLKIADSLWVNNSIWPSIELNKSYLDSAVSDFFSSVFKLDFSSAGAGKEMGQWISDNTNGALSPSIDVDDFAVISILNTVYFYDQWTTEFDEKITRQDTFYLDSGDTVNCSFMNKEYSGDYHKGEGYTSSWIQLKNGGIMFFVLPDEGVSVETLVASEDSLKSMFSQDEKTPGIIVWSIPKYSFGTTLSLQDMLKTLGMTLAFSNNADFSNMTNDPVCISKIQQGTHIAIDEKGVEAAAYTEIILPPTCPEPPDQKVEMVLNRPFLFGIVAPNGTLLFVGVCSNPAEN